MEVGLSLGSNLGSRLNNLKLARNRITGISGIEIVVQSPVYETEPVDVPLEFKDRSFLNAVLVVRSRLQPDELYAQLRAIETEMGRGDREKNMPRVIDIDIIYVNQMSIQNNDITVPHPRWAVRKFVVQPLADVRPEMTLPCESRTVQQILLSLPEMPEVLLYRKEW